MRVIFCGKIGKYMEEVCHESLASAFKIVESPDDLDLDLDLDWTPQLQGNRGEEQVGRST